MYSLSLLTRSPHQTNMTRNREMTTDSVCETCQQKIKKNEDTFCCIVCNCKMHLTKSCTSLSDLAINGITTLGKNIALLCNKCVDSNGYERIRKAVSDAEQTSPKQFKKIEEDMDELRKNVQEIKTLFSQTTMKPNEIKSEAKTKVPINATPKQENQNGIRIRGIPELNDKDQRKRQENDILQVKEILEHMQIVPEIVDLFRMGQRQEGKDRIILVKVPIWQKRLILSSACRLKTYDKPVFVSPELSVDEAKLENQALQKRRELINENIDKQNLRIRDGKLYQKIENRWTAVATEKTENSISN